MAGRTFLVLTSIFFYVTNIESGLITKCKSDDSECIKKSTQAVIEKFANGLPEHNVKTLDPLSFKRIDASTSNLKLILTDITITGLKDCTAIKTRRDKSKKKIFLKLLCNCNLESQYEMDGQLPIVPVKGKGSLHVTLRKIEINIEADMDETEKGGVSYWTIKGWKHSFTLKDKSDIIFENLFDGNEVLAQAAHDLISTSGNEIILDVGPTIIKTVCSEVVNNVNNFLHSIPAQELSID